jgi:hypothetical protein
MLATILKSPKATQTTIAIVVLHVFLSPSKPYYGDEDRPGIVVNRSVDDESTIGLTIFDFKKKGKERLAQELPGYDFSNAL